MPRPISSRMTSACGPAWLRIAAVSIISTMKVERPRARSSAAPTRREQAVDDADMGGARRHVGADLGEHGDQRVLAQEGRLAGHVGPGDQPDAAGLAGVAGAEIAVIGDERPLAAGSQRLLDHRMAAAFDMRRRASGRPSAGSSPPPRRARRARRRHRARRAPSAIACSAACSATTAAVSSSKTASSMASARSAAPAIFASQVGKLGGGEAHGARQRLAVDEAGVERRRQHALGIAGADLDEIAEHVVVLDAQRADVGVGGVAGLQAGDDPAALVAEAARLVEFGAEAGADEAAVALQVRQVVGERRSERRLRASPGGAPALRRRRRVRPAAPSASPSAASTLAGSGKGRRRWRQGRAGRRGRASGATGRGRDRGRRRAPRGSHRRRAASASIQATASSRSDDHRRVGRGTGEPAGEQAGAAAGDRAVDGGDQAAAGARRRAWRPARDWRGWRHR